MPLGYCLIILYTTPQPVPNLSDVLGCPIKTPSCDGANGPEWEDFVEAGVDELKKGMVGRADDGAEVHSASPTNPWA